MDVEYILGPAVGKVLPPRWGKEAVNLSFGFSYGFAVTVET